ncbi:hypothetical protein LTR56_024494 [Elasticomyces elasticus]|nr:hypothetical protein LTR22_027535 [Elasticomyces elasticus]KAK3618669.1 hypothetical protein LTR56_024494 [Elasticomyces elasticus]KAK4907503.1 hypothetical protein LTR49_023486 [Elasticomyces elasticus]KAK5741703.1 hypothetical protein LTS12_024503 [Elasticomyces elasticus]
MASASEPTSAITRKAVALTFAGLCLLNLAVSLDALALSVALPTIAKSLHANTVESYWTGTAFLLSSAVFQPTLAAFSNCFGRRAVVLLSLTMFIVGTIICGTAHTVARILAGRTIQGAGGGGLLVMTYLLVADLLPLQKRAQGMSLISIVWLIGAVSGPIMGAGFSDAVSWRWIFWFTLPFAGMGVVLVGVFLRTPHQGLHTLHAIKSVDWVGAAVFSASLSSFLVAISWGGSMYAWASYQLPLYYQAAKGYTVLISGVALLPQCLGSGISGVATGIIISKTGRYKTITLLGWATLIVGCGLLRLLGVETTVARWIFINVVSGLGIGIIAVAQPIAAQAATAPKHAPMANGLTPFCRALGQAVGIVVGSAIAQNVFKYSLHSFAAGGNSIPDLATLPLMLEDLQGTAAKATLLEALMRSLRAVWWCLFTVAVVGGAVSLAMKELSLASGAPSTAEEPIPDKTQDLEAEGCGTPVAGQIAEVQAAETLTVAN